MAQKSSLVPSNSLTQSASNVNQSRTVLALHISVVVPIRDIRAIVILKGFNAMKTAAATDTPTLEADYRFNHDDHGR